VQNAKLQQDGCTDEEDEIEVQHIIEPPNIHVTFKIDALLGIMLET